MFIKSKRGGVTFHSFIRIGYFYIFLIAMGVISAYNIFWRIGGEKEKVNGREESI
jgi:hypothetical protein